MDLYEKKFAEMQKYIPFLEAMIERLKKVKDKSREPQLQKMQSLHGILSKSNGKKLTIEKLDRCEELLLKLHSRVDKGTTSNSNTQSNRSNEDTKPNIANLKTEFISSGDNDDDYEMNQRRKTKDETPASPSPPASPDQTSDPQINVKPIIIPTERSEAMDEKPDRPASPDACELVASVGLREPKIIPTEQINPLRKIDPDLVSKRVIHKWNSSSQKSNLWQPDNKAGLFSTMGGSSSSKSSAESRHRVLRHIPTVPTPSKGASLIRKPVLVLDKKNSQASTSETESSTSKWDSPMTNLSDSDSHHQKTMQTSPKNKELPPLPKLPATRLLVSPPPALTMPPLTTEDLAELLSDDSDRTSKTPETSKTKMKKSAIFDRLSDRRTGSAEEDIENDRRWEEEYKQIVKGPSGKKFTSPSGTPVKHPELMKFPPAPPPAPQSERPTDPRKRPPSPIPKKREPPSSDPRYPENYDKHQHQPRDIHGDNSLTDHNQINSAFPRMPDGDPNVCHQNDDRNSAHYPRRPYGPAMHDQQSSSDPRRDPDYYNRNIQQNNRPLHHSPGRSGDPCNQSQWGQNSNYQTGPQTQNMPYQQQQRPDMWTMKAGQNNVPMEPHMMNDPGYMRQGQYPQGPNNARGPMMSPQDMNHGHGMDPGFRDDMPNQPMIPPLIPQMVPTPHSTGMNQMMQPQGYPVQGQYRGFPPENRPNVQQFDRPQDFPHPRQSWEQPVNRPPENMQYPRQSAPGQWNRGNNRGGPPSAGPGSSATPTGPQGPINRDRPYNDRGRGPEPPRASGFNRDPRTRVEPPAQHSPNSQNSARRDHVPPPPQNNNIPPLLSNVRRDPRIAKETAPLPAAKSKEHASTTDRSGRKSSDNKGKHNSLKDLRKSNEKARHQHSKNEKKGRRETDNDNKNVEKTSKDVMQSPLESLYGVIDTAAKTGKGYGLQKFKIPKIKRPEPVPSPPRVEDDHVEENWDLPDESSTQFDETSVNDRTDEIQRDDAHIPSKEADDKKAEVTSTTGESLDDSRVSKETIATLKNEFMQKETSVQSTVESEAVDTSTKSGVEVKTKESDPASSESGDWHKFLEAKLFETISEFMTSKKMKEQFKKLIGSDTSDGSDKNNDETEAKKTNKKKKRLTVRRRVSSDSSEEECLAERLGKVDTSENDKPEPMDTRPDDVPIEETGESTSKTNNDEDNKESSNDTSHETREAATKKGKPFRRKGQKGKPTALEKELQRLVEDAQSLLGDPEVEDKAAKEPAKIKPKRRNSLEMLQEDVREMFISNDVVTATGFRSCRLQKEDQSQLNSSVENLASSNAKKKGSTTSLDRLGTKPETDGEEVIIEQTNTRGKTSRVKNRKKSQGKAKPRQTAISQEIISSDSDSEDSARVDINLHNKNAAEISKNSDESLRADGEAVKSKDDSEDAQFLRRSERVGLRVSLKEPRIHLRKSDCGKIDSSKIMFDSSSDESFGIDVSELTAAVDISLHPEPQNSSSPVVKNTAKTATSKKRKTAKKRANVSKTVEEKIDNAASGDEVDSIASDLSRASSLTRGKKNQTATSKPDTNEELISDILDGFVDPATGNDGATTPTTDNKTNTRKKKKKKPSWSMGILKKKKKKIQSPIPPATPENEIEDIAVPEPKLESSFEIPESKVDPTEFLETSKTGSTEFEPKGEVLSDSSVTKTAENSATDGQTLVPHKEEPCSPVKTSSSALTLEEKLDEVVDDKKPLEELIDNKPEMQLETKGVSNINLRTLMCYVWSSRKERFKCMLCNWMGKNIVHHYTLGHPGKEMMISRLTIPESKRAIGRAMIENYDIKPPNYSTKETRKFTCRFCSYTTEGSAATAMEAFYEHCTTHTGEYRFRCNCCPYQTVARSSMRTHYYRKACRNKHHGNVSLAICEDPVPNEDFIFGYICTKCNFVQLKESNVEKHVKNIHPKLQKVDIVKIDMSSFVDEDLYNSTTSGEAEPVTESIDLDAEEDPLEESGNNLSTTTTHNFSGTLNTDPMEIIDEALKNEADSGKSETEATSSQETVNEGTPLAGNLSAFVCPPELENKEAEIQHERRKKMQEVVENIGISNKANEKRDLSIIDKLKDKMTTDIDASLQAAEAEQENYAAQASQSTRLPVLLPESVTSLATAESTCKQSKSIDNHPEKSQESQEVKSEPIDSTDQQPEVAQDEMETDTEDKSDKKPKDPLTNLAESHKDDSSDGEDSDRGNPPEQTRNYESDSSEQSDGEMTADVNSLLEQTFNITNAPMMTTIQRLAAKLQEEKSLPVAGEASENAEASVEKISTDTETPEKTNIPKPPNAIPISSLQRFFGRRNAMLQEVAKEVGQTINEEPATPSSPPKKFIRLRRLSGDKLSVPGPSPEPPVETPAPASPPPKSNETEIEPLAEIVETCLDPEDEEECSFLRIENVVSLAPGIDNNETMINDLRKAVANTPKTSMGVSVLKKSSPNILKRPMVVRSAAQLPVSPGQSSSPQLAKTNVKLIKVIKGHTVLKQKDGTHRIFGVQLKNPDVFSEMIKPENLRQFYKCMARTCKFSTDSLQDFEEHYRHHKETVDRTKMLLTSYDFQRCAYCTETLTSWKAMSEHLKDKHIYCQYQCSYCFYRALAQSYVELHQMSVHQGSPPAVLLGVLESPPIEVIDRREFVIPFVCHHECGKSFYVPGAFLAHLRTKHGNSLSIFKCHLCPAPLFKAEQLVAHYKLHGIYKYQCLYCIFGSEQSSDVHAHLSASHYNRPPHILERTLQPRPVRDKDVIQQLVVLNVDEGYKCTELTLVPGQDVADIPKNKHWLQVDRNTNDGSAVGVVTLPIGNIGMNRLFPYEKLDSVDIGKALEASGTVCNPATPIITKFRKVLAKKSPENMLIVDDTGAIRKVAKISDPLSVQTATKDSPAEDPLAKSDDTITIDNLSQNLQCNEEFVNIDALVNARKNKSDEEKSGSNASPAKPASKEDPKDKDDDSDIEILEDIEVPVNKSKTVMNKIVEPPKEQKENSKEEKTGEANTQDADPVIVCSSNENSLDNSLNVNSNVEEAKETFERPLTLEDIRNTGFTGRNLYRCGYDGCEFGAETAALLRVHTKECICATEAKNLNCVHCSKRFVKIGFLLEHFKLHGLKRFGCSLCKERWTQPYHAMAHMKMKHRQTYSKLIPADPKNPSANGLFVVEPLPSAAEKNQGKKRGRAKSTESEKIIEVQKLSYGPGEIDDLPRQPIYQQEVHCAVCPYKNKVRTNIIRHLQLHAKAESVPESGPVNPVPCLDKNERMFDKMVNLASSSHQNGRMGGTKPKEPAPDSGAEFLPKFIPENKRYVCGVTECNYLSIDEGMLRTHLKALHPDEPYFRCPHCPAQIPGHEAQNIPMDKMGVHLKMHDTRLYKCSHCNHHHYHRHVVERHLSDKHGEANPFVKVIREIEHTENTQQQAQQPSEESSGDPDGNHWKCNVCDFKCIYKSDMQNHVHVTHDEKAQFKCTACSYKTNNKITFDQHIITKHATDLSADYTMVFEKIKGVAPRKPVETGEAGALDEPFDTTPLWRRDMPRVRHIRGILFEDDEQPESPAKSGKRKSDVEPSARPAKAKPPKSQNDSSSTDRDNDSWTGSLISDTSLTTDELLGDGDSYDPTSVRIDTSRLVRKFGPYGSPLTHFWRCTICQCFKTKYKHDMRDHLYRDLKYFRYRCTLCGYSGVSRNSTVKHFMRTHENRRPTADEHETLPPDEDLETWVKILLKSQTAQMRGMIVDGDGNIIGVAKPKKANILIARKTTVAETPSSLKTATTTQTPLSDINRLTQTVDLTQAISEMKNKAMIVDTASGMAEIEDEDSNDALVIDSKDDGLELEAPNNTSGVDDYEPLMDADRLMVCKHCNMKFETMRGFKLHVQIRHLRRLNYLCPYCDTSSNSEKLMRKHLRLKHANLPEQVDLNPAKALPDLTNEFWEKEYGVTIPDKPKKRKRTDDEINQDAVDKTGTHVCGTCGFRAINSFGLGVHMRIHVTAKNYKCAYCTFAASDKFELWQHSEQNHANLDWRVGNAVDTSDTAEALKTESSSVDRAVEDYAEFVAAEASATSATSGESKSDLVVACFYCNATRKTLEGLKEHWKTAHKNTTKAPGNASGLPFRYKEVVLCREKKMLRCGYCPKRGTGASIRVHSKKKHPLKPLKFVEIAATPDYWMCQWCEETVDSEAKKKVHQNMFHSHLPPSFERVPQAPRTSGTSNESEPSNCPKCSYKTSSVVAMQKHVAKHVDSVRCKRCDKTFPDVGIAILHNTQAHPGEVSAIEGFTANVEKLMAKINWRTGDNACRNAAETVPRSALENWRNCGVAKKSTTKSAVGINPTPSDIRAVARKSTNPLPRYPPGTRFSTENLETESINTAVSYYGVPRVPVNLNKISTYITLGGKEMKLNCTTLAQLIDIEPRVLLKDLKKDLKNSELLANKN